MVITIRPNNAFYPTMQQMHLHYVHIKHTGQNQTFKSTQNVVMK